MGPRIPWRTPLAQPAAPRTPGQEEQWTQILQLERPPTQPVTNQLPPDLLLCWCLRISSRPVMGGASGALRRLGSCRAALRCLRRRLRPRQVAAARARPRARRRALAPPPLRDAGTGPTIDMEKQMICSREARHVPRLPMELMHMIAGLAPLIAGIEMLQEQATVTHPGTTMPRTEITGS
ncbi:unnamed protein product [Prorocentrum cordatum]|uniref:Uncharacterized protein n=1 Tax=Prorocentrum cordatum TaxID=2364126 RepID=A0ABN9Y805_9DINO|nr:unnamed protein product [Polarella glacialis]CAK0908792.1 unnamed protein product [Polarella glacialis]